MEVNQISVMKSIKAAVTHRFFAPVNNAVCIFLKYNKIV